MKKIERANRPPSARKKTGSKKGRSIQSWNKTPERRLLKCILGRLVRAGAARAELVPEFKRLVPNYQSFFDPPGVSDGAIWGRADTGRRGGKYAKENPDTNSLTRPYWEPARWIVEDRSPLAAAYIRWIAALAERRSFVRRVGRSPTYRATPAAQRATTVVWAPPARVLCGEGKPRRRYRPQPPQQLSILEAAE
jgi:hypothetical protein